MVSREQNGDEFPSSFNHELLSQRVAQLWRWKHIKLRIKFYIGGEFPRTAEVLVVISINDTTRNASFLLQDVYNVTLLEDALTDSVAVKLDVRYRNNVSIHLIGRKSRT